MSRQSAIAASWLLVCCIGSQTYGAGPPEKPTTAADDADSALKVFENDLIRLKKLAEQRSVAADESEALEDRVVQSRLEAAIAKGDKSAEIELLKGRVTRLHSRLSRVEKLRQAAVVSSDDIADAKAAVEEAEIKLARVEGNQTRLVELLGTRVSHRNLKLQRVLLLRQKSVVSETEVAIERLNLAKAKNELAAARAWSP